MSKNCEDFENCSIDNSDSEHEENELLVEDIEIDPDETELIFQAVNHKNKFFYK